MGDFKICFPMNKELDNKTELYKYQFSLNQDETNEFKKNIL